MSHDDGEILMGCWDCTSCGAKGLRGDSYQCSSCAAPRPDDVRFYLPEEEVLIIDDEGLAAAEAGPDWQCAFCESWVPATATSCINCHASLADSLRRQQTGEYRPQPVKAEGQPTSGLQSSMAPPTHSSNKPLWIIAGVFAALALVAGIYGINRVRARKAYEARIAKQNLVIKDAQTAAAAASNDHQALFSRLTSARNEASKAKSDYNTAKQRLVGLQNSIAQLERAPTVEVARHAWAVMVDVEECKAKLGEGWARPPDAFDVQSEERVHHHEKVLDRVDTLYRTETYRAQDGFTTETYTERVKTGTRKVKSGTRTQNLGNGRFRRTPTYRNEPVYKNVTKTRQKPRMVTKTRRVPYQKKIYKDKPIKQPWYKYKTKEWVSAPRLSRSGHGREPQDPEGTPPKDAGNEVGARRVKKRTVVHKLELKDSKNPQKKHAAIVVANERWNEVKDGVSMLLFQSKLVGIDQKEARIAAFKQQLAGAQKAVIPLEQRFPELEKKVAPLEQEIAPLRAKVNSLEAAVLKERQELDQIMRAGY